MAAKTATPELPSIIALRGIFSDVVSSVTFHQRLGHFIRLPTIFDRLLLSTPTDDHERAINFLRNDEDAGTRLSEQFVDFVFEDETRNANSEHLASFVRFSTAVVGGVLTNHGAVVDHVAAIMLCASFRLLFLMQFDETFEMEGDEVESSSQRLFLFRKSFKAAEQLVKHHPYQLSSLVLVNEDFFRIFISEVTVVSVLSLSLFTHCVSQKSYHLSSLSDSALSGFLDELSFKISSTEDPLNAGSAVDALLTVSEKGQEFVDLIRQRYEGLATLVARWVHRGFDPSIRRLLALLNPSTSSSSQFPSESSRRSSAAVVIQKTWRGYVTRRRMNKLAKVVARVQRCFRRRFAELANDREEAEAARDKSLVAESERFRQMRRSREKTMRSVEALPAARVDGFLQRRETEAATKIQAVWKGWRTRRQLSGDAGDGGKEMLRRERAARVLQRNWRVWLRDARARKKTGGKVTTYDGAAMEKRVSVAAEVERRKEKRLEEIRRGRRGEKMTLDRRETSELDARVQELSWRRKVKKDKIARSLRRCEATLASLNMDLDVILYPASLDELVNGVESAVDPHYRQLLTPSNSAAVRSLAALRHSKAFRCAREPWTDALEGDLMGAEAGDDMLDVEVRLDATMEKRFRENPHWQHLIWTLDEKSEPV